MRVRLAQPVVLRGHRWPWWRLYVIQALPPLYGPPLRGTRTTSTVRVALDSPEDAVNLAAAGAAHVLGTRPRT